MLATLDFLSCDLQHQAHLKEHKAKCKRQLKILNLESSVCAIMTTICNSVLRTSCQVSMVIWIWNSYTLKVFQKKSFCHNMTMNFGFWSRMYTMNLLHLQVAILDSFIVSRKKQLEILKDISIKTSSSFEDYYLIHIFPLLYLYFFILKSVQYYVGAFWLCIFRL